MVIFDVDAASRSVELDEKAMVASRRRRGDTMIERSDADFASIAVIV
jgi:hypothetical protein